MGVGIGSTGIGAGDNGGGGGGGASGSTGSSTFAIGSGTKITKSQIEIRKYLFTTVIRWLNCNFNLL